MKRRRKQAPRVSFYSLGCSKNLVDTEVMIGRLGAAGCVLCPDPAECDVVVVNTCAFIEEARKESLAAIEEAVSLVPRRARVIVTGCMAQRYGPKLREMVPEVDFVFGIREFEDILCACLGKKVCGRIHSCSDVPNDQARFRLTPRHFAYLRITEGCDNRCTYCAIPNIRGPLRSKPLRALLDEARELADDGAVELNLIGQDTAAYGMDRGEGIAPTLLRELAKIEGVEWIRMLYAHPAHVDEALIDVIADTGKVCNYVDLPIQHAVDRILARMGRRVTRADLDRLISKIRRRIPDACIRSTVIVGFPGETDDEFEQLLEALRDYEFDRLGAFVYSLEEGTPAAAFPDRIPESVAKERLDAVLSQQQEIAFQKNRELVGRPLRVLAEDIIEENSERKTLTRSYRDAPEVDPVVMVPRELELGRFYEVEIVDVDGYDLVASPREVGRQKAC